MTKSRREHQRDSDYEAAKLRWEAAGCKPINETYVPPSPPPKITRATLQKKTVKPQALPSNEPRPHTPAAAHTVPVHIRRRMVEYAERGRDAEDIAVIFNYPVQTIRAVLVAAR